MAVPAETSDQLISAVSCLLFEQFFLRGDEGVRWETRSETPPHCLLPSGTAAFSGQGFVALRRPAFTIDSNYLLPFVHLFSAIDLGEKKAVVRRTRGLDWSWTILAVWADDNLYKDDGVKSQRPERAVTSGYFSEYSSTGH